MNTAQKLVHEVETAGGHIAADGGRLELSAPVPLPDHLINALRQHKAEVMRLISGPGKWDAEDWRVFFDERAGIAEFDGGLPRPEAEARAVECCLIEWLNRNPQHSDPGRCAWCDKPEGATNVIIPFGTKSHGYTWLHHRCWQPWSQKRREEAISALKITGIRVHEKNDRLPSHCKKGTN